MIGSNFEAKEQVILEENNKALLEELSRELDLGLKERLATVDKYYADDCVWHSPSGETTGHEALKEHYRTMDPIFTDVTHTVVQNFAENDIVITHWLVKLKHIGEFLGIPATGKEIQIPIIEINRIENGKIKETWSDGDAFLVMIFQMGGEITYKGSVE